MKKYLLIILTLLLLGCKTEQIDTSVTECASCPEALACATSFAIDNKIYIFAGKTAEKKYSNSLYCYDCTTDSWSAAINTPLAKRVYPVSAVVGEDVYIGLGYNGGSIYSDESYLRDFWRYQPSTNSWEQLADYPDRNTDCAVSFVLEGKIYVGWGSHGTYSTDIYCYDPSTNAWSKVQQQSSLSSPPRMTAAAAGVVDGRCFMGTGFRKGSHTYWGEFSPADGTWKERASLPGKGRHNTAFAADEESVWLFGGWHYGEIEGIGRYYADILRYDAATDKWQRAGVMPCSEMINGIAVHANRKIYFGLGETPDQTCLNTFYSIEK